MQNQVTRESIGTLNELMQEIQTEILDVKSGRIKDSDARVVLGNRKAQLKIVELGLQHLRIMGSKKPMTEVPLLPAVEKDSASTTAD